MDARDIAALAILAGGVKAFKDKADKDFAELPEQKEAAERRAKKRAAMTEMKKGGAVKSSASKRADGIAQRGKTKGRMV